MKSLLDAMAMNHCKSMATPGSKGQEGNNATEKLDGKEHREFRSGAGICRYMTEQRFDIAFSTKVNHERGSWTDRSLKDKVKGNRALPQRTPAMCVELPLGGKAGRCHPCDGGCKLGRRPEDKVLNVWRSAGNWPVHQCASLVSDTGNSVTTLS